MSHGFAIAIVIIKMMVPQVQTYAVTLNQSLPIRKEG
jgi:hypothetical protein